MATFLKNNLKFIIFLLIFGLIGGYFTALYSIEIMQPELLDQALTQVGGKIEVVILISTVQSILYALILGLIGKSLADRLGLWRKFSVKIKPILSAVIVSIVGGSIFILADTLFFGNFSDVIKNSYVTKPTLNYFIASVTYGGVVEEVMLRLFFMSLIAFILWKLSRKEDVTDNQIILANIIAAILFAAGHLPATIMSIGVTPMIIVRCFIMNGGYGLIFGRLYRKYGIQYATLAHAGVHIISKLIWILFI